MINLFQIDKSGSDIFEKGYSVVLVVNKKQVYGVNIPQGIKDPLISSFKKGELKIDHKLSDKKKKNRFRLRFHTAVVIKLVERALYDLGSVDEASFEICDDFPGHFHEIKDMIFKHVSRILPCLRPEDIVSARFQKPSLIDDAGAAFRTRDKDKLRDFKQIDLRLEELYKIVKR